MIFNESVLPEESVIELPSDYSNDTAKPLLLVFLEEDNLLEQATSPRQPTKRSTAVTSASEDSMDWVTYYD